MKYKEVSTMLLTKVKLSVKVQERVMAMVLGN